MPFDVDPVTQEALDDDPAELARTAADGDVDDAVLLVACADEIDRLRELVRWVNDQLAPHALTNLLRMGATGMVGDPIPHRLGDTARRVWPTNMLAIAEEP